MSDHLVSSSLSADTTSDAPPPSAESEMVDDESQSLSQSSQSSRIVQVPQSPSSTSAAQVIAKIEAILEDMVDALIRGDDAITMPYRNRSAPDRPLGTLTFPGRTTHEAVKFTRMMRIMELSRDALANGRLITKRNIYYQNPDLFKHQTVVDHLVDDLAFTLGVGRNALNIVAASKGLIAGPLRVKAGNSVLSYSSDQDHNDLIPPISTIDQIDFAGTRWVLVIEKEATFRTLVRSQFWKNSTHGEGIIVTGKGYADLATLEFLHLVHTLRTMIPIYCVVDCDPHGIDIMRTYKYGSRSLGHEVNTRVPGLHWLGVKMDDIFLHTKPSIPGEWSSQDSHDSSQSSAYQSRQNAASAELANARSRKGQSAVDSTITLTASDRKKAVGVLGSIAEGKAEDDLEPEELDQMRELQVMLMLNAKAEIQAMDNMGDLSSWIDRKMAQI